MKLCNLALRPSWKPRRATRASLRGHVDTAWTGFTVWCARCHRPSTLDKPPLRGWYCPACIDRHAL